MISKKAEKKDKKAKKKPSKPKKTAKQFFQHYVKKTGITMPFETLKKRILIGSAALTFAFFMYQMVMSVLHGTFSIVFMLVQIVFMIPAFLVSLAFILVLVVLFFDIKIYQRKVAIEAVLPDFLQLASSNIRSGMTIDRALWCAIRPQFGVLAKEVELVAKQTMSGEDLDSALMDFGDKYDSPMLKRSVHLIVEGLRAGGELGALLEKISLNLQKSQGMQKEMSANVTSYVMFISFATVVAAPFLYGLSLQLISVTQGIMSGIDMPSSGTMPISVGGGGGLSRGDFIKFAIGALSVTSFFSACIISMIKKGNIKSGLKYIPIFISVSIVIFFIAAWVLGKMFSGMF